MCRFHLQRIPDAGLHRASQDITQEPHEREPEHLEGENKIVTDDRKSGDAQPLSELSGKGLPDQKATSTVQRRTDFADWYIDQALTQFSEELGTLNCGDEGVESSVISQALLSLGVPLFSPIQRAIVGEPPMGRL